MTAERVWTFFYGSFINLEVLEKSDVAPEGVEVARLAGFDIRIAPLANLVPSEMDAVYGIVALVTHHELERLYRYAREELGGVYNPRAVLVETLSGAYRPALCYIAPSMTPSPASSDYVDRIILPARERGFPEWYVNKLERFRPPRDR